MWERENTPGAYNEVSLLQNREEHLVKMEDIFLPLKRNKMFIYLKFYNLNYLSNILTKAVVYQPTNIQVLMNVPLLTEVKIIKLYRVAGMNVT